MLTYPLIDVHTRWAAEPITRILIIIYKLILWRIDAFSLIILLVQFNYWEAQITIMFDYDVISSPITNKSVLRLLFDARREGPTKLILTIYPNKNLSVFCFFKKLWTGGNLNFGHVCTYVNEKGFPFTRIRAGILRVFVAI